MLEKFGSALLQQLHDRLFEEKEVNVFIKREDLLHPTISGNKWRKLKYNIAEAKDKGHETLLTFGGAYSNHIYSTAAAANEYGLQSIGIIRGDRIEPLNFTLAFAEEMGMQLHFVSRDVYREKKEAFFIEALRKEYGDFYLVPEGGSNGLAIKGCTEIVDDIKINYDYLCVPVGTGGTISGLIASEKKASIIGFSALKGDFLSNEIATLLKSYNTVSEAHWTINNNFHFGGYAKVKPALIDFIRNFKSNHNIQLDPIYTGKMMFGLFELITNNYFDKGTTIVALHTGGLQGIKGMEERLGIQF